MPAWNLFVKGLEGRTLTFVFEEQPSELTVSFLKERIQEKTHLPPNEQRLIFDGKQLEDGKYLSYYHITDMATIFLVMRLRGGAKRPPAPTERTIDPSVPRSMEECMILMTEGNNVKMPCSHVISPEGLIDYSWNEVCVNGKTCICCCLCGKEWDRNIVRRYGGATDEEMQLLQECISRNVCIKDPDISECPGCTGLCERMDKGNKCSICHICTRKKGKTYHFCWDCKREWIGSPSNEQCGNEKCNKEVILEKLRTCPEKEIQYLKGLKCPSIRACPSCGSLIEHESQCKHITCQACKKEFCFVCLRLVSNGSSSCGIYYTKCAVAPRQKTITCRV